MLAFEQSRRHEPFNQYYQFDAQEHYSDLNMNDESFHNAATFASLPFSYYENPSLFVEASQKPFDYEFRSPSSHSSHQQTSHDCPPSLLSSASGPSVASASSSTIGSPYSVHAQTVSSQDTWNSQYGLGFDPAIVNHEVFASEYVGAGIDPDLSFAANEKIHGSFVGECADLSSFQKRSSKFPVTVSSSSLSIPHQLRTTASPELLTIDSILDRASAATAAERGSPNLIRGGPSGPIRKENSLVPPSDSVFKSPTTPASAHIRGKSPTAHASVHAASYPPAASRVHRTQQQPHQSSPSSPTTQHGNNFQTHFFAQSSGSFMPPLESSCSFSPRIDLDASLIHSLSFPIFILGQSHRPQTDVICLTDPALIEAPRVSYGDIPASYTEQNTYPALPTSYHAMSPSASPAPSPLNYAQYSTAPFSPSVQYNNLVQQPEYMSRRQSVSSYHSGQSPLSGSVDLDDDNTEKGRCPFPECGRVFKDLKAHMLTHQLERPEKCPIVNCEYHQKGFARKYDKNRHTLTHYKGTMVCGFCPGSGSAAEKSFNRADVFKRHLTSVHGVEQAPPNSRKRSPTASTRKLASYCEDATGKCSTCVATFVNAQDFYEHLDDCVLRVVQQEEPSEAINHHHLANISQDEEVKETMERNMVKTEESFTSMEDIEEEEDDENDDEEEEESLPFRTKVSRSSGPSRAVRNGGISKPGRPRKLGLTHSKGGVPLIGRGRKKRKDYPPSWGMSADRMQMKKRVLCVYDGERRLWKDDLMMHNEFEVRMSLPDGKSYVTDLDVETLKRAQAFHNATEEEKGPWVPEQPAFDLNALMA
jgi:hypothetical protein